MAVTTNLQLTVNSTLTETLDLSTPRDSLVMNLSDALATGTSANQADVLWHDSRLLSATSEDLDLAGILTDGLGNTVTFVTVKAIVIHNTSTTATESLAVGGAASAQFVNWVGAADDEVNVGPDGVFLLWSPIDGYDVTATTGDLLKIDSGADNITYEIAIIGTSA